MNNWKWHKGNKTIISFGYNAYKYTGLRNNKKKSRIVASFFRLELTNETNTGETVKQYSAQINK